LPDDFRRRLVRVALQANISFPLAIESQRKSEMDHSPILLDRTIHQHARSLAYFLARQLLESSTPNGRHL
jgi:hypothetical protein